MLDLRHTCVLLSPQINCVSSASPDTTLDLPRRIREARAGEVLSQRELAERLGVSERTLQGWELGTAFPQPRHRRVLLRFLAFAEEKAA